MTREFSIFNCKKYESNNVFELECDFNFFGNGYDHFISFSIIDYDAFSSTRAPSSSSILNCHGSRIGLRENLDLEDVFGIILNENELDHEINNAFDTHYNEIFCDHGGRNTDYYASASMFIFDVCNFCFFCLMQ